MLSQELVQPFDDGLSNAMFGQAETRSKLVPAIWGLLSMASAGASAYHGYKRNDSVGWAIVWALLGGLFPIITPVVAFAQGFGKPK